MISAVQCVGGNYMDWGGTAGNIPVGISDFQKIVKILTRVLIRVILIRH